MKKSPAGRVGSLPRIATDVVQKLFAESKLTRAEFAALAGAQVRLNERGGYQSSTVDQWLAGTRRMSAETYQLLTTRLWLLKEGHATFEELVSHPLKDVLSRIISKTNI